MADTKPEQARSATHRARTLDPDHVKTVDSDPEFEQLLDFIRDEGGFDFTGYKRSSLMRRCLLRLQDVKISGFGCYMDYLRRHPEEFQLLFRVLLINVTEFFRDPQTWEVLQEEFMPRLLEGKGPDDPIRLWSAGCASGEEAYSLLIVLAEILGVDECRRRVKIYATDADEEALVQARGARYPVKALEEIPVRIRDTYFRPDRGCYVWRSDLRGCAIFGRHNLVRDPPIANLDLLACRNTLMYFRGDVQTAILHRFHFALTDPGVLFLGRAEMLRSHASLFTPLNRRARIFGKARSQESREWRTSAGRRGRIAALQDGT